MYMMIDHYYDVYVCGQTQSEHFMDYIHIVSQCCHIGSTVGGNTYFSLI